MTLITNRTQSDVDRVKYLAKRIRTGIAAEAEYAEYLSCMKGAYNASDLNRVCAAAEELAARFRAAGYNVPGYQRIRVAHPARLPAGYTEVAYIESDGTQYVDTGFKPNQDTRLILDFEPVSVSQTHLFGSRSASSGSDAFLTLATNECYRDDYYNNKIATSLAPNGRIIIDKNKNITTIDNTTVTHEYTAFNGSYPICLFASNTGGTLQYYSSYKFYSCQIYDNGTLVRDFVPCINASAEAGLYDLVSGAFYGNAGTGVFTAGAEVSPAVGKYEWGMSDTPTAEQMAQYLNNVRGLKDAIHSVLQYYHTAIPYPLPDVPADMYKLTYQKANDIEQILQSIENQLNDMNSQFYWYSSGDVYAGEI